MGLPLVESYTVEDKLWQATAQSGQPQLRVYTPPEVVVVLGRGSKPEVEVELERCLADEVLLRRRRGGGCSVVLDPGNVIVAASLPVEGLGRNLEHFDRLNRWVVAALTSTGIEDVGQKGISDLVLGDRKVGGTCIYRTKGVLHYSASLLVEPDLALIERYLKHPPREPDYRRGRPHRDFLTTLGSVDAAPPLDRFAALLKEQLERRSADA